MTEPTLCITPKKYTGDTTVISVRIPKDMLSDIDDITGKTGWTRNELLTRFIEFSLRHTDIITPEY